MVSIFLFFSLCQPNHPDGQNGSSIVYASLDLPNPVPQHNRNGNNTRVGARQHQQHHQQQHHAAPPRRDRTEYAEIQFQPQVYEQASL